MVDLLTWNNKMGPFFQADYITLIAPSITLTAMGSWGWSKPKQDKKILQGQGDPRNGMNN